MKGYIFPFTDKTNARIGNDESPKGQVVKLESYESAFYLTSRFGEEIV